MTRLPILMVRASRPRLTVLTLIHLQRVSSRFVYVYYLLVSSLVGLSYPLSPSWYQDPIGGNKSCVINSGIHPIRDHRVDLSVHLLGSQYVSPALISEFHQLPSDTFLGVIDIFCGLCSWITSDRWPPNLDSHLSDFGLLLSVDQLGALLLPSPSPVRDIVFRYLRKRILSLR